MHSNFSFNVEKALCYPNPCKNGATCIDRDDRQFECSCVLGFKGDLCEGRWIFLAFPSQELINKVVVQRGVAFCSFRINTQIFCIKFKDVSV
jgi:extradiol dioxygenase family protein